MARKRSAAELRTQIYIATDIKILPDNLSKELVNELKTLSRQLQSLIKSLKKPKPQYLKPKT